MQKWNNQNGAALVIVLLAFTVLSILGLALAALTLSNLRLTTVDRDNQAAYYIAEGGANQAYAEIEMLVGRVYEATSNRDNFYTILNQELHQLDQTKLTNYAVSFGIEPYANIDVTELNESNPRTYQILSEGVIGNRSRKVKRDFQINWQAESGLTLPENTIAIIKNKISLSGSASLEGDIYIDSSHPNTIHMKGGSSISDGITYVPEGAVETALSTPTHFGGNQPDIKANTFPIPWQGYDNIVQTFPGYPAYPTADDETIGGPYNPFQVIDGGNLNINSWQANNYTLSLLRNMAFSNISVSNNNTLNIDTNGQTFNIVVNNLLMENGHINIIGSGKVNFFVKNDFVMGAASTINANGNIQQVNLYMAKEYLNLQLNGRQKIVGSLFAKSANVHLTAGGGFQGYLVTGGDTVVIDGGAFNNLFLLAPYADVQLNAGATVTGSIIANSLTGSGGAKAIYQNINLDNFPFGATGDGSSDNLITKQPIIEIN